MITIKYNNDGIRVDTTQISKYNKNLPFKLKILKHVSGESQWETDLNDYWFATYPNTEIFDVVIFDSLGNEVLKKTWDIFENGNDLYKSFWLYNKNLISQGKTPKGLVIGTHDGEFGEWVPIVLKKDANVVLVEASENQYRKLAKNYRKNKSVKLIKNLVTTDGGEVEFFEGGAGYTNTVIKRVIREWEKEEIKSSVKKSISITDLILQECNGQIDWLHLDVEGLDAKLIMSIDESKVDLPKYIIFEITNLSDEEKNDINFYLHSRGYVLTTHGVNCEAIKNN